MSHTPLRTRSSLGHSSMSMSTVSTPVRANTTGTATFGTSFRPPSRPTVTNRTSSPVQQHYRNHNLKQVSTEIRSRSRPGSSMGMSRPTTPLNSGIGGYFAKQQQQEPYTGSIAVSIRPNPRTFTDNSSSQNWIINQHNNTIANIVDGTLFTFDHVFPPSDLSINNNYQVYLKTCKPIVEKFLEDGYNGTVFAYGMTGSGKTYSMKGDESDSSAVNTGFVELAINDLFEKVEQQSDKVGYEMHVSYLEIYNEKIIDLLDVGNTAVSDLKIRDDHEHGVKVIGLTTPMITSKDQLLSLIKRGDTNRKTSATDFNARSSRSHSILQIKLKKIILDTNLEIWSTLSLCDLAGSERASSSLERRKEGSYINKSLLALSNVINKLSSASSLGGCGIVDTHISYRDSKLTRLLQPALSGKSLVSILCTIHMGGTTSTAETYKTLRFAARAKDIVMNVEKNICRASDMGNDVEMQKKIIELYNTIEQQKQELMILKSGSITPPLPTDSSQLPTSSLIESELKATNKILNDKVDHLTRLADLQKTETIIIKDTAINDIIGCGTENQQTLMTNIEEFYRRTIHESEEYKQYIAHLENQLKTHYMTNFIQQEQEQQQQQQQQQQHQQQQRLDSSSSQNSDLFEVLKEQEDEIMQLKEMIKDKDHIIRSFTKTSRLRKLVDSSSTVVNSMKNSYSSMDWEYTTSTKKNVMESRRSESSNSSRSPDKENEHELMMFDFKLSPKKQKSSFDVYQTTS